MTPEASPTARGLHVGAAALAALAAVGFLTGIRGSARDVGAALATRPSPPTAPRARNYSDMRSGSWGPNSALYPALFTQLSPAAPSASSAALDAAPTTVPHRPSLTASTRSRPRAASGATNPALSSQASRPRK